MRCSRSTRRRGWVPSRTTRGREVRHARCPCPPRHPAAIVRAGGAPNGALRCARARPRRWQGVSASHKEHGGDLVWNIGTGYFGCRRPGGGFDAARFRETAATPSIKMIELKLSQGAKPAHGGILPASKVTPAIAEARGVNLGEDCNSPPSHSAFSCPHTMMEFIAKVRAAAAVAAAAAAARAEQPTVSARPPCGTRAARPVPSRPLAPCRHAPSPCAVTPPRPVPSRPLALCRHDPSPCAVTPPRSRARVCAAAARAVGRQADRLQAVRGQARRAALARARDGGHADLPRLHHRRWRRGRDGRSSGGVFKFDR